MTMLTSFFTWPQKSHAPCVCAQISSLRIHHSVPLSTFRNPPDFPNFNHQRKYGLRLIMTELVLVDLKVLKEACSSIERTGKIFKGVLKQSQQAKTTKRQINEYDYNLTISYLLKFNPRSSKAPKRAFTTSQPTSKKAKKKARSKPQSPDRATVQSYRSDTADDVTSGSPEEETIEDTSSGSELSE